MKEIARILVVSRMTRSCRKAVHHGVSLAKKYNAELNVIHVAHNLFWMEGWNLPMISIQDAYQKEIAEIRRELDEILKKENDTGMAIREIIRKGDPTKEILKTVQEEKIDLLVMLAHEEGRLEQFLFGRSNEEIVRRMPCSVMLVKEDSQT